MIMLTHEQFKSKRLGKWYAETKELWRQCVAGCKRYAEDVYGEKWSFWWTAFDWWNNKTWYFSDWNSIEYKKWLYPPQWAIVFFKPSVENGNCGHVAIVDMADENWMSIIEQNWGGKGNYAPGDEFTIRPRSYSTCLWRKTFPKVTVDQADKLTQMMKANSELWWKSTDAGVKEYTNKLNNRIRSIYWLK